MPERFLLYIDILGFSEMTKNEPRKVARIYAILDSLNVHQHDAFKTIVFSDTVLVYNPEPALSDEDRNYYVWYLIEFAEDLHHRLTGQDVFFRAVLTSGNFAHYRLKNIECFFGDALISAYMAEKEIPSIGLFLDKSCEPYNKYFRAAPFDRNCSFIYLNRSLEGINEYAGGKYPFVDVAAADFAPLLPWQVRFLEDVYTNMRSHQLPAVRAKFLTAWDFYVLRYPDLIKALIASNFTLAPIGGLKAWGPELDELEKSIRYYKRIGAGTDLSRQLTGAKLIRKLQKSSKK